MTKPSFYHKYSFWLLLVVAIIIRQLPLVSIPFNWLESYFHEMSHGIAALITGGSIIKIQLFANGAGLCTTRGGWPFLISFMGYAGATVWGIGIYLLASSHQRIAQLFSALILVLILTSIVFWARDLLTLFILAVLMLIFALTIKMQQLNYLQKIMQVLGLMVLLNSLFSPTYLLDGRPYGDGATLAEMTSIPEFIWVVLWFAIALAALYFLSKRKVSVKVN